VSEAFLARVDDVVSAAKSASLLRTLDSRMSAQGAEIEVEGRRVINFTSNDYLGMAAHPRVIKRVQSEVSRHGFGAGSAALLSGRSTLQAELEREIAAYTGAESALLFSSGYLANTGTLPALIGKSDFVAHDRFNHASLIDGVLSSKAAHRRYPHLEPATVTESMGRSRGQNFLVSESLFSMDGDQAPLPELQTTAAEHNAVLYIDDAHGFGVTGDGRGASAILGRTGNRRPTTIIMLTLGKALGSAGAVVLAPASVREYLVQRARTFIYDTALPPVCAAAALEALEIMAIDNQPVRQLQTNIATFRSLAKEAGLVLLDSTTPIQPLMIGDDRQALEVSKKLYQQGFYVRAIRPPTVPRGTARLRITLTATHTSVQLENLVAALLATRNL